MKQKIYIVGVGMGNLSTLTYEAQQAIKSATVLIGAQRLVEPYQKDKITRILIKSEEIAEAVKEFSAEPQITILMSGDVSFFSGTKKLVPLLDGFDISLIPGISSISYFCAKTMVSYDDGYIMSLHGKDENLLHILTQYEKVITLTDLKHSADSIAKQLLENNFDDVQMTIGENLSYYNENITRGFPKDICKRKFSPLSVVLLQHSVQPDSYSFDDESFIRGKVPMSKGTVRHTSIAKLHLNTEDIVFDIGAGTGSVSIEIARHLKNGKVYAIEHKKEAVDLIRQNCRKHQIFNLTTVEGRAKEVLPSLEIPTKAFIGGSGNELSDILDYLFKVNPFISVVLTSVTMETATEAFTYFKQHPEIPFSIETVSAAKGQKIGNYTMFKGENPIYIITAGKNVYE